MAPRQLVLSALAFGLLTAFIGMPTPARAHYVEAPCDFITAGGFVYKDSGIKANFGAHGGCKHGEFWGHVNFVDHETRLHLRSTKITGYLYDPATPKARDICGQAVINDDEDTVVDFRVRLEDNGEPGKNDLFGIAIDNRHTAGDRFTIISARKLANGQGGGGNVQLHKGNRSNSATDEMYALQEWQMCGDLDSPR